MHKQTIESTQVTVTVELCPRSTIYLHLQAGKHQTPKGHGHGHGHGKFIKTSTRDDRRLNGLDKLYPTAIALHTRSAMASPGSKVQVVSGTVVSLFKTRDLEIIKVYGPTLFKTHAYMFLCSSDIFVSFGSFNKAQASFEPLFYLRHMCLKK